MSEHTPGPWRHATNSNIGNMIEGPSGKTLYAGDIGFRAICTVQACCASNDYEEQDENLKANIALIAAAPDMLEALRAVAETTIGKNAFFPHAVSCLVMNAIAKADGI